MKKIVTGLLILALLASSLALFAGCGSAGSVKYADPDSYSVGSGSTTEEITAVEIYWPCGSVNVSGALTVDVDVREDYYYKNDHALRYRVREGVLQIYPAASGVNDAHKVKKNLTVSLPLDIASSLERVEIKTIGDTPVTLKNVKPANLSVQTAAGNVDFQGQLKRAEIVTESGSFKAYSIGTESLRFTSKTGSAELALHLYGYVAVMENAKGSFESGYECYQNGNIYTYGTQETTCIFSTAGKVTLNDVS